MFVAFLHYLLGPHRWKTLSCLQMQPLRGVLRKRCLKTWSKFTGEYPCRSLISIKLRWTFIEIVLRNECSPVNLLHVFRTPLYKNTYGELLLCWLYYTLPSEFFMDKSGINPFMRCCYTNPFMTEAPIM